MYHIKCWIIQEVAQIGDEGGKSRGEHRKNRKTALIAQAKNKPGTIDCPVLTA